MTLRRRSRAWNIDGSSTHKPPQYGYSWIQWWEYKTQSRRGMCSFHGCRHQAKHGGHVWIKQMGPTIVPICPSCNKPDNTDRMQNSNAYLRSGVKAVKIRMTRDMKTCVRRFVGSEEDKSEEDEDDEEEDDEDEYEDVRRQCVDCDGTIPSTKPAYFKRCYTCWKKQNRCRNEWLLDHVK